jgi:Ca2+-binding RTX toxin-like protein
VLNDSPFEGGTDAAIVVDGGRLSIETASTLHRVTGTDGADIVALGDDAAIVEAGAGDDQLYAGDGTAILSGGDGNDTLVGGNDTGSDYLLDGGLGDDTLVGGDAAELLIGGAGADTLSGGAGDDTLVLDAFDTAEGGAGVDTFWVYEASESGADVAQISDFEQGVDILRVSMPATSDLGEDTVVQVTLADDGESSQVSINGDMVAFLHGASNVLAGDIVVDFTA